MSHGHGQYWTHHLLISSDTPTSSFCVLVLVVPKHWSTDWQQEYYLGELIKNRVLASTVTCWTRISLSRAQESEFLTNFPGDPNIPSDLGSTTLCGQIALTITWLSKPKIECHHLAAGLKQDWSKLTHWRGKNLLSACLGLCSLFFVFIHSNLWRKHSASPFLVVYVFLGSVLLVVTLEFLTFKIGLMHCYWAVRITFFVLGNILWC